jgi:TP901 family phage tail tape measure protein
VAFRTIEVQLVAVATGFKAEMAAAAAEVRGFSGELVSMGMAGDRGVRQLGTELAGLGVALAGIDLLAGKAFVGFDQRMRNVASITQDGEKQFRSYEAAVLDISSTVPKSANDIAEGLYHVASAGFTGAAGIAVVQSSAKAAAAGLTDTTTAANAITGTLNAYGQSALNAGHISDVLFNTVRVGQTTFGTLAQQMGQFIGIAGQLHIPLEQVGAAFSTITVAGVPAEETGVALERVLLSLIHPTSALNDLYHQWGFETGQQAIAQLGLAGVIQKVTQAAGGNADKLFQLTGDVRGLRGMLALGANDGALFTQQLQQFGDVTGQTQKALEEQSKSLGYQLGIMKNELDDAGIALAKGFLGPAKATVGFIGDMAAGFSHLPAPMRDAVAIGSLLFVGLEAIGGAILYNSRVIGAVSTAWGAATKATRDKAAADALVVESSDAATASLNAESAALARNAAMSDSAAAAAPRAAGGISTLTASGAAGAAARPVQSVAMGATGAAALGGAEAGAATAGEGLALSLGSVATGVGVVVGALALGSIALAAFGHNARQAKSDQDALKDSAAAYVQGQAQQSAALILASSQFSDLLPKLRSYKLNVADTAEAIMGDKGAHDRLTDSMTKTLLVQRGGQLGAENYAKAHKDIADALAGHKVSEADLSLDIQLNSNLTAYQSEKAAQLIGRIQQLVAAHKIDTATARELAGALGQVNSGLVNQTESATADAEASLRDAQAKKMLQEAVGGMQSAMAAAGDPTAILSDAQSQLTTSTSGATKAAQEQLGVTKDQQTIANDAAQAVLDHARAELELERANHGVATAQRNVNDAQKAYNDLLSFGLAEEHEKLDISYQQSLLDQKDATVSLADAEKKLSDIRAGRVGMADSARPRAIADAQEAVSRAQLQVRSTALSATDAQRALNSDDAASRATKLADAEQKITDALLSQREANQQVSADQLAITQQQTKLAQGSQNAATAMGIAADKMAGSVGGAIGKVKLSYDQWTQAESDRAAKMKKWFGDITYLAATGHRDVANEMLKMGIDSADYAAEAVQRIKGGQGLGPLDDAMKQIASMSTADFSINWNNAMNAMPDIARLQGQNVVTALVTQLQAGTLSLKDIADLYAQLLAAGANAVIATFGGKPIVVSPGAAAQNYAPGTLGPFAGGQQAGQALPLYGKAGGGVEAHIANQPAILYGERETGGEAFIPRHGDRHKMAGVLATAASWHGYALVPTAEGHGLMPMASGGIPNPPLIPTPTGLEWFTMGANQDMTFMHDSVARLVTARRAATAPPSGAVPPGSLNDWINAAIAITGVPQSWAFGLYEIAQGESGGDPHSANDWDSNARAGNPSEGLMQTTISTFRGNALPGHGDIWNPVDNLIAAIRYIQGRYRDIGNVPGVRSLAAGGPYKPYRGGGLRDRFGVDVPVGVYDTGGYLPTGASIAVNNTGRPEAVGGGGGIAVYLTIPIARIDGNIDRPSLVAALREGTVPVVQAAMRQLVQEVRSR